MMLQTMLQWLTVKIMSTMHREDKVESTCGSGSCVAGCSSCCSGGGCGRAVEGSLGCAVQHTSIVKQMSACPF